MLNVNPYRRFIAATALALATPAFVTAQATERAPMNIRPSGISDIELTIWRDPSFKAQMAASFLSETDVEPKVLPDEIKDLIKVQDLLADEKTDEAEKLLLKMQKNKTASATVDYMLANIYFLGQKSSEAVENFKTAINKFPKFRRAYRQLAIIQVQDGDFKEGLKSLSKVIELGGADPITFGLLGFCYSSTEDNVAAEAAYRMASLLDPNTREWRQGLLISLFRQERFADVAAMCQARIEADPSASEMWLLQANCYIGLNQPERAAQNFEIIDQLGKSTPETLNLLGDIYVNQEIFDLAVDHYIKAMELSPTPNPERAIRASQVMIARGAISETRRLIGRTEELTRDNLSTKLQTDILRLRALTVPEGAGDEEARILQQILEINPLDGKALLLLGEYYEKNSRKEEALNCYERAEVIPDFEADAKVHHAQLLVRDKKYDEAIPLLQSAQQINNRSNVQMFLEQVERAARSR